MKTCSGLLLAALLFMGNALFAHDDGEYTVARPDGHAPFGVTADHMHKTGEWMLSYRLMLGGRHGMMNGSDNISLSEVYEAGYMMAPVRMDMEAHMFGGMYAVNDNLTLVVMVPYIRKHMEMLINPDATMMINNNGGSREVTTQTEGIGDLRLVGLFRLHQSEGHQLHMGLGISIPTGFITQADELPGMDGLHDRQLPSGMQLGSGTVDLYPSLTWLSQNDAASWGAQLNGILRTDHNSQGYRLGNQAQATSWIAWACNDTVSLSARAAYTWQEKRQGNEEEIPLVPMGMSSGRTSPVAYGSNTGGQWADVGVGLNIYCRRGILKSHRFAIEYILPVWEDLNGYQLGREPMVVAGWQYSW